MSEQNPSILSHVSIGTNQFERAVAFYDKVLATLGCKRVLEHPGAVAWGREYPEFWVQTPIDGQPATAGNGCTIGIAMANPEQADAITKNVCARIPKLLAERMEEIGSLLDLNKREMITLALNDFLAKAVATIEEFDAWPKDEEAK